ncbi:MAG: sigma-54 dependent transcriptional regulator [Gammaproteobacteria bacterium]
MASHLICWIGLTDLRVSNGELDGGEQGPIGQAVTQRKYDSVVLLGDHPEQATKDYVSWLEGLTTADVTLANYRLSSPTDFGDIYEADVDVLTAILDQDPEASFTYHISPGTPAMAAVWILLSKTRFPAELIETSREAGLRTVSVPFDISAEFIPDLFRQSDQALVKATRGQPEAVPGFEAILHQSPIMQKVISRARQVAPRSIPVLIEGESGTGKELFSRAIHKTSPRSEKPFIAVNCGAIPTELVESLLFGHKKGAFTGAAADHQGYFESAIGGTLFLDEVGELPLETQVRLLRAIQEKEIVRLGENTPRKTDVRLVAATNRPLSKEVEAGRFREDLYYRLAVAVIKLPPLRKREGDLSLLTDKLLQQVNQESQTEPGYKHKNISSKAKNLILKQSWPGNVRQLLNTLRSAAIWAEGESISIENLIDAMPESPGHGSPDSNIMSLDVSQGIDLNGLVEKVERHYIRQALAESNNKKAKAAELLGLGSYQTLSNRMQKYKIKD